MPINKDFKLHGESWSYLAMVFVVLAAYVSIVLSPNHYKSWEWVALISLGLIYLLFGLLALVPLCTRSRWGRIAYFVVELTLGSTIVFWSHGAGFLVFMFVPSVAVIFLPLAGQVVVGGLIIVINGLGIGLDRGWSGVGQEMLMIASAVIFVMVFSHIAAKEQEVRSVAERLAGELGEANQKLREYAIQAEELATAKERNRLSRDIHDTLGHYLTAIHMQINAAKAVYDQDPSKAMDAMTKAQNLALESLGEVRRAVAALRITPLEGKQFLPVLEDLVSESNTAGINTALKIQGEPRRLDAPAELALYRVAQEGLTNVRKHSQASSAEIRLDFSNPSRVRMIVHDDGIGANISGQSGFGLIGLGERLHLCGGNLRVVSAEGAGFSLETEVPG